MKRLILVRSGDTALDIFSIAGDNFNNVPTRVDGTYPTFSFFNKTPFTYQLVHNVLSNHPATDLAISHYINNPYNPAPDATLFHPLDLHQLLGYADIFDTVIYGVVQTQEVVTASNTLALARAFARNPATGDIIDLEVNAAVDPPPGQSCVHIVPMFSLTKIQHSSVYCIITDPKMLAVSTGIDTDGDDDDKNCIAIRAVTAYDGTLRDNIMSPQFSPNVEVVTDNTLFITGDTFSIELFTHPANLLQLYNIPTKDLPIECKSNLSTSVDGGKVNVTFPMGCTTGFIKIKIPGGPFFENPINPEILTIAYLITR